jgi:DNA-binding transcriptional ArsR family regulator
MPVTATEPFEQTLAIIRAVADEQRVRALLALSDGELCACQITELLGLAPSTVSKHLSILRQAGLIRCRREGRWAWFRQVDEESDPGARTAINWLERKLSESGPIAADRQRLVEILEMDPEEISRRQMQGGGPESKTKSSRSAAGRPVRRRKR